MPPKPLTPVALVLSLSLALACCATAGSQAVAPAAPAAAASAAAAPGDPPADTVVLKMNGKRLTLAEVDALAAGPLTQARTDHRRKVQELREQALERYVDEQLLQAEAKRRGLKAPDDVVRVVVEEGTPRPTDAELQTFYDDNKDQMRGAPLEEIKERLRDFLHDDAKRRAFAALLEGLRSKAGVVMLLPQIRVKVAATGPARGPADAPVVVVIFSDFECPYCSRAVPTIDEVVERYGDQVRVVFRDFPLGFHKNAKPAAAAAKCAGEQGKFWPMHDRLFAHQDRLSGEDLAAHARQIEGLDADAFDACLAGGKMAAKVDADLADGKAAGVSGTPAFFVNGIMISGAQPFSAFKTLIDRELARAAAPQK